MSLNRVRVLAAVAGVACASLLAAPLGASAAGAPPVPVAAAPANQVEVSGVVGFSPSPTPAFPTGFDWSARARAYDDFAYDWTDRGSYSTILVDHTATNMPAGSTSYKMPAYYGDTRVTSMGENNGDGYQEAVAQIASVVSGTLVGIDKSHQACAMPGATSCDYVDMLQTFFHTDLGVAKDTPLLGVNGDGKKIPGTADGWYAMIPNVLYYMLGEQYPDAENMQPILRSIADKFYDMVVTVGGANADFTMQDYNFPTGTGTGSKYVTSRDETADIASATAAIELWAYEHFGDAKYLQGARWTMDALERDTTNTYYEILPLLAPYVAARMNALYGTSYDVAKYFRWLMKDSATRNGWGTMGSAVTGGIPLSWGAYDVSGLSGSLTDSGFDNNSATKGYAFAMNSFATTWLAATAKYDTRYANSVGRWLLNVNNAARFYFPDQLPADKQQYGSQLIDGVSSGVAGSSTGWATDDRAAAIAYEGLQQDATRGIYATSDVPTRSGNWGTGPDATGLGLYGSSWIGFMSVIHPTDVTNVLRTDLNALDTFGENTYPTSLYYNPSTTSAQPTVALGTGSFDLYDSVSRTYLARGVTGSTTITVPASSSVVLVTLPAGAALSTAGSITSADGAPIAYDTNPQRDLALGGSATASLGTGGASAVTDGSSATSWTTTSAAARTLTVDLGSTPRQIGDAVLEWGAAHPATYTIDTSLDGSSWSSAATVSAPGGTDTARFTGRGARFVRVTVPATGGATQTYALRGVSVHAADLALGGKVSVIGTANSINASSALTDGSLATRWESPTQDAVWASVDLGEVRPLGSVQLVWETAAAKAYTIKVSDDGATWSAPVASVTDGVSGETRTITLPAGTSGRYVRLDTSSRTTTYAHSLFRFSVYGEAGVTSAATAGIATTTTVSLAPATQAPGAPEAQRAVATVQVSSQTGETPGGTVQLREGSTVLGTASVSAGDAGGPASTTLRVPALGAGTHVLQAVFTPASGSHWEASTSAGATLTVTTGGVVKVPVQLTVAATGKPTVGKATTLKVTARTTGTWSGGTVVVTAAGAKPVTVTVPASGTATVRLAKAAKAGKTSAKATFAGSATLQAATATTTFSVTKAKTTTKAKAKRSKVVRGKKATVVITVKGAAGTSLKGKATVAVKGLKKKGTTTYKVTVNAKGKATFTVKAKRLGTLVVKTTYRGNANQAASKAKAVKVKVRR